MSVPHYHDPRADVSPESREAKERELVGRVRHGDEAAFESLFRTYHARLASFAYRYVQSQEIAEELVQEVFLDLWSRRALVDVGVVVKTYLFIAVKNAALSYLRHEKVERRREGEVIALFSGPRAAADVELHRADLAAEVQRAIARLPERCRVVFSLRREHEMSHAQIAEILGISPRTVENQLARALKSLRKYLAPHWP
jgi:RNA polymerase sigma-70 factor (ECF subfamily)